jgi:glycosyltransferase involved in cell wall biosynthesis
MPETIVSIIIPCFNSSRYIEESINSARKQTHRCIEIICVDNGSIDDTISKIEKIQQEDDRIKLLHEPRSGANYARNLGMKYSSGEYLQFLDSDDLILPQKIEIQLTKFTHKYDVIVSDRIVKDETMSREISRLEFQEIETALIPTCLSKIITTCNPLFRKSTLEKLGGWNEDYSSAQDWELNLRLALKGAKFGYTPGYFFASRTTNRSLSSNWIKVNENAMKCLNENRNAILQTNATKSELVQKKIFFTYYIAAVHSNNSNEIISTLESWKIPNQKKFLKLSSRIIWKLFGLKFLVQIKKIIFQYTSNSD